MAQSWCRQNPSSIVAIQSLAACRICVQTRTVARGFEMKSMRLSLKSLSTMPHYFGSDGLLSGLQPRNRVKNPVNNGISNYAHHSSHNQNDNRLDHRC